MNSRSIKSRTQNRFAKRSATLSGAIFVFALLCASHLHAQIVATYSFEDGKADGWTSFYNASTPTATQAAAYAGSWSLLTSTSSTGTGGPQLSATSLLLPGAKYTITGWVRLTTGESAANANFTIQRSDPSCSGGTCYDTIGGYQVAVDDSGWAQIGGAYTASATETGLNLYAQLVGATTAQSFYLDDVVITETAPPPGGTPIATYTFANDQLDGWAPFGTDTVKIEVPPVADPNGDKYALLASKRTAAYMGPGLNLLSVKGIAANATYQITAYVLLAAPDASNPTATLSTKLTDCAEPTGGFTNLATSTALSSTVWTKVQGTLSFSNLPALPTGLTLYIQSSSAKDSFYVGDVTISETVPPPPSVSQQDNTGISSTFEDGGLDGWGSRSGSSTLANSTAAAHAGTHSLLTTGRIANWDGPSISIADKMYVGSVYNVSGWVRLLPTDGSSHVINVSLQTSLDGNVSYPSVTAYPGVTVAADGNWHQISVLGYNMSSPYDSGGATLYFQTAPASGNDLVSFYVDDFQLTYVAPPTIQTGIPSIYQTLAGYFPVGAAVDLTDISGVHRQLLEKHFDSIVSGNDMKWQSVEPTKGTFDFANADSEVDMAVCNKMRIRGHNLVWATGAQTPAYATGDGTNSPGNQATVTANIEEHIQSEVEHFGKKVYVWDVVNEPLDPSQSDCLAHGPFYQVLGKSYIDIALKAARKYAPAGTQLFINDYSTTDPSRLACMVKVVKDLKARGIPIDGIGHEMHNDINYPTPAAIVNAIETVAEKIPGIKQQITEMDESIYNGGDDTSNYGTNVPASVLAEQGWLYYQYFEALRGLRGKIEAVTFWGIADDDTWLDSFPINRTDLPLPFSTTLKAKPAYWGIVDPAELPGFGLEFNLAYKELGKTTKVNLLATNGKAGIAYAVTVSGLTLKQFAGEACKPVVTTATAFPLLLGDIGVGKTASTPVTIDFSSCKTSAKFIVSAPWSSSVYHTGTFSTETQYIK